MGVLNTVEDFSESVFAVLGFVDKGAKTRFMVCETIGVILDFSREKADALWCGVGLRKITQFF